MRAAQLCHQPKSIYNARHAVIFGKPQSRKIAAPSRQVMQTGKPSQQTRLGLGENIMSISAGARLDRFEVLSLLGVGGMGEVYLAQDTRLRRKVALKILPSQFTTNADRLRRFEQEAYAASSLNHPNIVTIFEIGNVNGAHFMAHE